jgi:hypothetical protein
MKEHRNVPAITSEKYDVSVVTPILKCLESVAARITTMTRK